MTYRGDHSISRKWQAPERAVGSGHVRRWHVNAFNYVTLFWHSTTTTHLTRTLSGSMNLSRLLCSMLRNDRRLSEINAHGLWHAIHFNLRSVSFMTWDNDDVLAPCVCSLIGARRHLSPSAFTCTLHTWSARADRSLYVDTSLFIRFLYYKSKLYEYIHMYI